MKSNLETLFIFESALIDTQTVWHILVGHKYAVSLLQHTLNNNHKMPPNIGTLLQTLMPSVIKDKCRKKYNLFLLDLKNHLLGRNRYCTAGLYFCLQPKQK